MRAYVHARVYVCSVCACMCDSVCTRACVYIGVRNILYFIFYKIIKQFD